MKTSPNWTNSIWWSSLTKTLGNPVHKKLRTLNEILKILEVKGKPPSDPLNKAAECKLVSNF